MIPVIEGDWLIEMKLIVETDGTVTPAPLLRKNGLEKQFFVFGPRGTIS